MIPNDYIITTRRCRLRRPGLADIPHVFSATREPGFNDGMLWDPPKGMDELREPFNASLRAWDSGQAFSFTIEGIASGDFIGRISIRKQQEDGVWNLGFWTHPKHQGCGFMTEVIGVILAFAFNRLNAIRIEACHAIWNKPSQRVLEKNGMTFVHWHPIGAEN